MWYYVDPHSGIPIYVQLKEQIKKGVASGQLEEGEQLPTVRELALQLTINPNTVAKVYQELEREGVITTSRGLGTFVAPRSKVDEGQQKAALEEALERLMVEAYQLCVDPVTLEEGFSEKLRVWWQRLKKGDAENGLGD